MYINTCLKKSTYIYTYGDHWGPHTVVYESVWIWIHLHVDSGVPSTGLGQPETHLPPSALSCQDMTDPLHGGASLSTTVFGDCYL